jgi:hypothetical protein
MRGLIGLIMVLALVACQPAEEAPPEAPAQPTFTADDEAAIRGMLEKYVEDALAMDWVGNRPITTPPMRYGCHPTRP